MLDAGLSPISLKDLKEFYHAGISGFFITVISWLTVVNFRGAPQVTLEPPLASLVAFLGKAGLAAIFIGSCILLGTTTLAIVRTTLTMTTRHVIKATGRTGRTPRHFHLLPSVPDPHTRSVIAAKLESTLEYADLDNTQQSAAFQEVAAGILGRSLSEIGAPEPAVRDALSQISTACLLVALAAEIPVLLVLLRANLTNSETIELWIIITVCSLTGICLLLAGFQTWATACNRLIVTACNNGMNLGPFARATLDSPKE